MGARPTLPDLVEALAELPGLDPIERARQAPALAAAATAVLADVRTAAVLEAVAGGRRQADIARQLGISRAAVSQLVARRRPDS